MKEKESRVPPVAFLKHEALAQCLAKGGVFVYNIVMYYVYLLKLNDNSYYTGSTQDVKKRFAKHNKGNVLATKGKRPLKLVFYCSFPKKNQALQFEKYLKNGSGQAFRNKHLI